MTTFFTSDTHFSHRNIIDYCGRPFVSIEEMNEAIIASWNQKVKKDDIVYHLGDVAFTNKENLAKIISSLNGKIYLVPGNHDKVVRKMMRAPELIPSNFEVLDKIYLTKIDGRELVLCHYPLDDWHGIGHIHLHGHTHGKSSKKENRYDVGIDVYGEPITLDELHNANKWGIAQR
jgi:calcineurin-like phosphoesterase family protein